MEALEVHFAGDRLSRRQFRHLLSRAHASVWVAEDAAERVVGDAVVAFRRGDEGARLYSLVVDPAARGRGVGALLLATAEDDAVGHGARLMRLEVREDNPVARALYERHGYEPVRRIVGYYHDGAAALRMRKRLEPPAPQVASPAR